MTFYECSLQQRLQQEEPPQQQESNSHLSGCLNPTVSHRKHINENNLQQAVQEAKEHRMSLEEAA
jgi:hypothetical protein